MSPRSVSLLALLTTAVLLQVLAEKREMGPAPFVLGSRYGRAAAPPRLTQKVFTIRNDRFYLGTRYGKRSLPEWTQEEPPAPPGPLVPLLCEYTGVMQLLRCRRDRDDIGSMAAPYPGDTE